ncbi:hypothetical protein BaRGS_00014278 [Batillaria attramentaria]|uniref:Uncharacterized protein n=1 Tax=Batillaria attramentaria TaxID=370345 RepID=A0ABD0L505_9CAEN
MVVHLVRACGFLNFDLSPEHYISTMLVVSMLSSFHSGFFSQSLGVQKPHLWFTIPANQRTWRLTYAHPQRSKSARFVPWKSVPDAEGERLATCVSGLGAQSCQKTLPVSESALRRCPCFTCNWIAV